MELIRCSKCNTIWIVYLSGHVYPGLGDGILSEEGLGPE